MATLSAAARSACAPTGPRPDLRIERVEERKQRCQCQRYPHALPLGIRAGPVVETLTRVQSSLAARHHRLQHRIGNAIVKQRGDDRSLGIGMDLQSADVLLLDESIETHARC